MPRPEYEMAAAKAMMSQNPLTDQLGRGDAYFEPPDDGGLASTVRPPGKTEVLMPQDGRGDIEKALVNLYKAILGQDDTPALIERAKRALGPEVSFAPPGPGEVKTEPLLPE